LSCLSCAHWRIYEGVQGNSHSDAAMEKMHWRNCAMEDGVIGHAMYFHQSSKACELLLNVTPDELNQRRKWVGI